MRATRKVRDAGVIVSQAVLMAVGVDEDGRRQIRAVVHFLRNALDYVPRNRTARGALRCPEL
jgi:transposase-like protein